MTYLQNISYKKTFYTVLTCFIGVCGSAQNDTTVSKNISRINPSLSGIITDARTASPLAGASIFIHDVNKGIISKPDGSYKISNIPPGKYLVEVSYVGYSSNAQTITIRTDAKQDFSLQQTAVEREAVTVTGVSSATRIRQNPQPVNIIRRQDFISRPSTNAIDAITRLVPGVNAVSTGPAISKPFIRGLGYNRVLTINDDVRQEGQQWGDEHGIEIDDYSIQRIEVLKGPASMMYGSDAIAGVINVQSQAPATEGMIKANFLSEYQTNNALRGFYGNIGGTKNGFSWNAYGSYKGASDYKNKYDGYVFNSKFYNKNFGAMIGYRGNWGYSHLLVSGFDQHIGMIEGERDSATGAFVKSLPNGEEAIATNDDFEKLTPEIPFQHITHFKITTDNNIKIGNSNTDVIIAYQQNQRREFGNADAVSVPDAWFNLQTLSYAIRWHLPYIHNWRTTVGITGMYQTNQNEAEEAIIPDYDLFDIGGFVFTQYSKNKFTLSGGLRYDTRHDEGKALQLDGEPKFTAFTRNFSNISGSAGISYEATKSLAIKANIARGFRAPNFAELASNGAHEGTNRYEVGDNGLLSEVSLQADAGIELTTEHISLNASIFYNHINDFIFYERLQNSNGGDSVITDTETGDVLQVFRFAQQDAGLYGAELSLDIHPHPLDWLHFENTFSYTRGKFSRSIDGSDNIPFIPPARLLTTVAVDFLRKGNFIRNISAGLESDYNFAQHNAFTGYNTETATPGYWLVGVNISADFVSKGKTICTLIFTGENLGDVAYQNHLSRLKYTAVNNVTGRQGVFNAGRNFGVKLNVPLSF